MQREDGKMDGRDLVPGDTCWRIEQADCVSIIIDGADYFRAAKQAMLSARRCILMIGWDFDTRIEFEPEGATLDGPNVLGDFLPWLTKTRRDVDIYMLKWDLGALQSLQRGMVPLVLRPLFGGTNFRLKLDTQHPAGATHHSKIIVIDDQIAFCGGIDMTAGRWDTPDHSDDQPLRGLPGGSPSKPWHDVTSAVAGPVAAALGDLARQRWYRATGETLAPPRDTAPIWPDLAVTFTSLPVAIARTYPDYKEFPQVREIEALYLRIIATVQRTLYVETQYLASARMTRAIADRLTEPDGPEIILVLPQNAEGWLRQKAMDGARKRLLNFLWANDPHDRFAAYYPVTTSGAPIYVHAKILVADDRVIRVGSSNLNNRSMGFDTECDIAIEAAACTDPDVIAGQILALRRRLVCEHLGVEPEGFDFVLSKSGGLIAAIETLRGPGRSLRRFSRDKISDDASVLAENELVDPETVGGGLAERIRKGVLSLMPSPGF